MVPMTMRKTSSVAKKIQRACGILGLALLAGATPAAAQSPSGPITPQPGKPAPQAPQNQSIQVKVDLVNTPVVATDGSGKLVVDLIESDFRVYDNGVEQKIEDFGMGGAPLSVAIVVESSSRVEALLPEIRRTGILFTQEVLGANGDATVIGYDDQVERLLGFTSDHDAIERTITHLQEGTSGARLYDALSEAVGMLRARPATRRRVIVVMGEAVDTGSEEKLGEVLREAQLANITIYSVGLSTTAAMLRGPAESGGPPPATPPGTFGLPPFPGSVQTPTTEAQRAGNINLLALATWIVQHVTASVHGHPLDVATVATGGLYQPTFHDRDIETAIGRIGGELHAQYTLTYRPEGTQPTGYHEIKVTVDRPGVKVRARPGYYLSPPKT
jgi:VWFA-related protein